MKQFLPLYKIDSKNKTRVFKVDVLNDNTYQTCTGLTRGKLTCREYSPSAKGKNTVLEQVEKDAQSKWDKKYKRELYREDLDKPHPLAFIQPMLAYDYTKVGHRVSWKNNNYVAQKKLNGVRCIAQFINNSVRLASRKGKVYSVPHIERDMYEQVFRTDPDTILDGELYIHGVELGDVTHAVANSSEHPELAYHAFDLVDPSTIFTTRHTTLCSYKLSGPLQTVPYSRIRNEREMMQAQDSYAYQGYEGVMIRDIQGYYEQGTRSLSLFKYKIFQDAEFKITDVNKDADGGATLVLETNTGIPFRSRPMGSNEFRKKLLLNKKDIIGEMVTVKYSTLLATGAPEFNRTLCVGILRNYE